jgi:1-deoxy-D-xylulose-5-phosphate reductoisomerase
LGSTGSIGQSALAVIRNFPAKFRVAGLSTNSNVGILSKQISEFRPYFVCVNNKKSAGKLSPGPGKFKLFTGEDGLEALVSQAQIDKILLAISGSAALLPLLKTIDNGKDIALANKEALVMAGPLVMEKAKKKKIRIIPVDSEQSAIWQCLNSEGTAKLRTIYLTASGGPFRKVPKKGLRNISIKRVLRHPRWKMGKKITVDSATLMNKGLELLEAMFLFDVPCDKIKVLIHPEAIVHSMVEFIDGVVLAQLSATDMRIPIQYAFSYPERLNGLPARIDFCKLKGLHFERPDYKKFPCLRLAARAAEELGTMPAVLNAANEVSVEQFLKNRISFMFIPKIIERVLDSHRNIRKPDLDNIRQADAWARKEASGLINRLN